MDTSALLAYFSAMVAAALAVAVARTERRSLPHWLSIAGLAWLGAESLCVGLSADADSPQGLVYWQNWRLCALSFLPGIWLCFSLTYARGNAPVFLRKWRLTLAAAFLAPLGLAVLFHGKLIAAISRAPSGDSSTIRLATPGIVLNLLFLLAAVLVLMNLERTFRASVGTMRWRIKFTLLGLGLLFAVRAYSSSQDLLFRALNLPLQALNSVALLLACLFILRSLMRAGHLEVAVYPSQSVLHNSLTVVLAGIYLMIVGALAKVVTFFGGDASFKLKTFLIFFSLVLLTILLLSDRLRLVTRRFVSRHFQRPIYDYRTVWRAFSEATARQVEPSSLCEAIVKLVSELFQALSVTVWRVAERKDKLTFAASTSLSQAKAIQLKLDAADSALVIAGLAAHRDPVDFDASKEIWAVVLRRLQPDEFRKGGNRICVPLLAAGELLGIMTLGDRVAGVPYSLQDFELLKAISDQAAASLLNLELSQRLAQAKQLEAFQAMSAFFVHDLKNTASTLSLTLQNLPVHFDDPNFRADSIRGISKTVTHIQDLIGRLTLLRQEPTARPAESDLNNLVELAIAGLDAGSQGQRIQSGAQIPAPGIEIVRDLQPLPKMKVDPAQIQNVLTNLLLNARDALGAGGRIRIETRHRDGWVALAVADNGCGMSPEFLERSLFRPFQTTKKKGLGIGMFQCKMIVEAHRGRIEVESEPGKGSTFRVLLPVGTEGRGGKMKVDT